MSSMLIPTSEVFTDKKSEISPLGTLLEVNENAVSEIFQRLHEEGEHEEKSPRIFTLKDIKEPLTIESLNNAIYELGVVNLCWPEITEPVFETRTCFPQSYYTNSSKERLLLAYAENFRRQFLFHYKMRKPLLLQAPNECGLQKMVCTTIRPTKLCFADTITWQGIVSLVSDYFDYEPLTKPILHVHGSDTMLPEPSTSQPKQIKNKTNIIKKKLILPQARLKEAEKRINESFRTLNRVLEKKSPEEDECDIYGKLLAKKLRKYPERLRNRVMYQIDGLLLDNPYPEERPSSSNSAQSPTYQYYPNTPSPVYIIASSPTQSNKEKGMK